MPSNETITEFLELVSNGRFIDAMERFYAPEASARENNEPPRIGLEALLAHERATLAAFKAVRGKAVEPPIIDGDNVVVHWNFEFDVAGGGTLRLDEVAVQKWKGDRLVSERFFYDPSQLRPA